GLAFGGGLGILAVLEEELVDKRRAVTTDEFLTIYGIGRIVPSGTMTALAVAYGYKFGGLWGTLIALAGLSLPVFVLTIALTIAYHYLRSSRLFDLLPITIMPAALALLIALFNVMTFGNGPVMIPLLHTHLVEGSRILTEDQLLYAFTIARVTPGQANFYVVSIGYMLYGITGAIVATLAIILPGYIM